MFSGGIKHVCTFVYHSSIMRWWHGTMAVDGLATQKARASPAKVLNLRKVFSEYSSLFPDSHYSDVIMGTMTSQITSLTIVYSTVYSGADQRKYQSSASLAFVRRIHRSQVNSPHKWPVTRKMFPFDDVIMEGDPEPVESGAIQQSGTLVNV